jgi:sulfofructose kinase
MLLDSGPGLVVITDGVRGSWSYPREGEWFHQPAYRLPNVVDTTGCGDSYHGAFLFGLLKGMELEQIARASTLFSSLGVQYRRRSKCFNSSESTRCTRKIQGGG